MDLRSASPVSFLLSVLLFAGCKASVHSRVELPPGAEACSLSGELLYPPPLTPSDRAQKESDLERARAEFEAHPDDPQALIWYGRRLGYLGRFNEALSVFSEGVKRFPDDPWMWRFRGHRFITLRQFGRAESDLEQAARLVTNRPDEIEPAAAPNSRGVPLDTLQHNIYYHLALARYLQGDFEGALPAWRKCLEVSTNPDTRCSATNWLYITLRRLGRSREAREVLEPITADLDVIEYHAYHRILLVDKGLLDAELVLADTPRGGVDFATVGYGLAMWHLAEGHRERSREILEEVARSPSWHAFGRIAAECELARN
jgi:tetratricopeptide (TPR) repeat protein